MTTCLLFYAYCLFENDDTLTTLGPAGCNRADSTGFNDEFDLFFGIFPSKMSRPNVSGRLKMN